MVFTDPIADHQMKAMCMAQSAADAAIIYSWVVLMIAWIPWLAYK